MDPMTALMGQLPDEDQQRLMAQALRGQAAAGGQLSTSSIAPVAKQGGLMQQQALGTAEGVGLSRYREKMLEEHKKNREASILKSALAAQSKAKGEDSQFTKISGGRADKLYDETEKASTVLSLMDAMPQVGSSSGLPMVGSASNWLATNAPAFASEDAEIDSDTWRQWNMEYNNIIRHGLFGSALTATEQAAWKAASINPNMTPEQIARNMENMRAITQNKAAKRAISLMNEGRPKQWIYDAYVDVLPAEFWEAPREWTKRTNEKISKIGSRNDMSGLSDEELDRMIAEAGG